MQAKDFIHKWHEVVNASEMKKLDQLISEGAVFSSPVVFKPLVGKEITKMYLAGSMNEVNYDSDLKGMYQRKNISCQKI